MGQHPQQYIHNIASSVMGQLDITYVGGASAFSFHECDADNYPNELWGLYGLKVVGVLSKMGPSALGRIASCGVGPNSSTGNCSHWKVNEGINLNGAYDGKGILTFLAAYVVVAAIVDIVRAHAQKMRDEEQVAEWEQDYEQAMKDYVHFGPKGPPDELHLKW